MIKKLLLIIGIMLSGSLFAEPHSCNIDLSNQVTLDQSIKKCKTNDLLYWSTINSYMVLLVTVRYCDQEKAITTREDLLMGVCTYIGKTRKPRT